MSTFDVRIPDPMLTVPQVAAVLDCERRHVYRLLATGDLHPVDVVGWRRSKTRIRDSEVQSFLGRRDAVMRARLRVSS